MGVSKAAELLKVSKARKFLQTMHFRLAKNSEKQDMRVLTVH